MWRVFWILIVLGLVAAAAGWLADHPGTLRLEWLGYRIDTSAAVLVFAVAAIAALAAVLYRLWTEIKRAPRRFMGRIKERRRQRGFVALSQGLVAVAAGDAADAKRQARRAETLLSEPAMTRLLSAQAAQLSGDTQAATRFFTEMLERPETEFLGLRGLLMQAMKRGDDAESLRLVKRAFALQPKSEWVARTLFDLQVRAGLWHEAESTIRNSAKSKIFEADDAKRDLAAVQYQLSLEASERGDEGDALSRAAKAHDLAPGFIPAALRLAHLRIAAGRPRKAAPVIETAWAHGPHESLLDVYWAATESADTMQQLRAAQFLANLNPNHLESRLAVAKAALEARLWGVARGNLEAALEDEPTSRACRMMATLDEVERGDDERAREWLMRAATATPDPAWHCERCGNTADDWQALCGKCGGFNTFSWRTPPRVLALPGGPGGETPDPAETGVPALTVDARQAGQ